MISLLIGIVLANPSVEANEAQAWDSWAGTYRCEDCGPKGSSVADGKGPTPCWDYTIAIQKPEAQAAQGKAEIQINGFQTAEEFTTRATIEGDGLDLFVLPQNKLPLLHLFKMKKAKSPSLAFKGVESRAGNGEIACKKQ